MKNLYVRNGILKILSDGRLHTMSEIFIPIPDGFRIKKIYGDNTVRAVMKENAENSLENEISYTGSTSLKEPIYFDLELTDEWSLSVNYLTQYKMIKNYVIGLVVIFAILVACPYLVKGIAALIAG